MDPLDDDWTIEWLLVRRTTGDHHTCLRGGAI
jgi:hypothetical protein